MKKQNQKNKSATTHLSHATKQPYAAVIKMMAGIRISLLNSESADTASLEAGRELKPGDELQGVFGVDDSFVDQFAKLVHEHAPLYAGKASPGNGPIPFLTISARPDGDVELNFVLASSEIAAAAKASRAAPQNQYRAALSLEPEVLPAMKKFLRDRQPVPIKIM